MSRDDIVNVPPLKMRPWITGWFNVKSTCSSYHTGYKDVALYFSDSNSSTCFHSSVFYLSPTVRLRPYTCVCAPCFLLVRRRKGGMVWKSCRAKIKLFGTVTSLPLRKDRRSWTSEGSDWGVDQSIHHDHAGLTQQKMECQRGLSAARGQGTRNNIFWRLSGCPIREADIWTI